MVHQPKIYRLFSVPFAPPHRHAWIVHSATILELDGLTVTLR